MRKRAEDRGSMVKTRRNQREKKGRSEHMCVCVCVYIKGRGLTSTDKLREEPACKSESAFIR